MHPVAGCFNNAFRRQPVLLRKDKRSSKEKKFRVMVSFVFRQ